MSRLEKRNRVIWQQIAAIPRGKVASYGQIAELAGIPRGARMVGRALGKAPASLQLPWFRVLNARGRISIPGSSPYYQRQIDLLRAEGIAVNDGSVDMQRHRWAPSLDELMWGPGAWSEETDETEEQ